MQTNPVKQFKNNKTMEIHKKIEVMLSGIVMSSEIIHIAQILLEKTKKMKFNKIAHKNKKITVSSSRFVPFRSTDICFYHPS